MSAVVPIVQTKGARTREAIGLTAIQIICDEGYQALTIAALSEGAGIRRNSYYTHFKDLSELIDKISRQVLNGIGSRTIRAMSASQSVVLARIRFVLSMRETDPAAAVLLAELYVHHAATAAEVHRRLERDIASDRRRGLLTTTGREATIAALVVASSTIELLRPRSVQRKGDRERVLKLVARVCGLHGAPAT